MSVGTIEKTRHLIEAQPGGEPTLTGSLCTVAHAIELQAYGYPDEQILAIYPTLSRDHLRAASAYAADFWGVCLTLPEETESAQ